MYFFNRTEAGRKLADRLEKQYRYENTAVLCLTPGAVLVGQEIARRLHTIITLLLMKDVRLPGVEGPLIGTVDQAGGFTYNQRYSTGEIEEFLSEFHQYVELEKMHKMHEINQALGQGGLIERKNFAGRSVILVSDGLKNGTSIDAAVSYLKPINTAKIIAAVPIAAVPAVDRLHVTVDEMHVLDVIENYFDTDHYYEDNYIPDKAELTAIINDIILHWG